LAISRARKEELIAQYEEAVKKSTALLFTDYRGLTTAQVDRLRAAVRDTDGSVSVVRLTLLQLALKNAGYPVPMELLSGPVAVGFCYGDVPAVAKAFRAFAKEMDKASTRGGIVGHRVVTQAEVEAIADLPPLEVVRAQLLGILSAPARGVAGAVAGGVRQVINVLNAYAQGEKEQAGIAA